MNFLGVIRLLREGLGDSDVCLFLPRGEGGGEFGRGMSLIESIDLLRCLGGGERETLLLRDGPGDDDSTDLLLSLTGGERDLLLFRDGLAGGE